MKLSCENTLTKEELDNFIATGFVKIEAAFDPELAEWGRRIIWADMGKEPGLPQIWTEPVVRILPSNDEPFGLAVNTARLHRAYNQLVGENWCRRPNAGLFVVRFPSSVDPNDTGWHIDASFSVDALPSSSDGYENYRVNLFSRERGLLMLFLFSDVKQNDAPTRIRVGSHLDIPPVLVTAGENGLAMKDIGNLVKEVSKGRPETIATGNSGDAYLCHPFLVHAAQKNVGENVKFMAQPPLQNKEPFKIYRSDGNYCPVELAIRSSLRLG